MCALNNYRRYKEEKQFARKILIPSLTTGRRRRPPPRRGSVRLFWKRKVSVLYGKTVSGFGKYNTYRVTLSISDAHRVTSVVGAHIRYKTFPSGRALTLAVCLNRLTISFVTLELYPPPPAPSSISTAKTHPITVTPLTLGNKDIARAVSSHHKSCNSRVAGAVQEVGLVLDAWLTRDASTALDSVTTSRMFGLLTGSLYSRIASAATAHPTGYAVYECP
jgi:hypothetical protein